MLSDITTPATPDITLWKTILSGQEYQIYSLQLLHSLPISNDFHVQSLIKLRMTEAAHHFKVYTYYDVIGKNLFEFSKSMSSNPKNNFIEKRKMVPLVAYT